MNYLNDREMVDIKRIGRKITPLVFLPSGELLCYRGGQLLIWDQKVFYPIANLFLDKKEKLLGGCRLFARFLRIGVRASIICEDDTVLLSKGPNIYEFNTKSKTLSQGWSSTDGCRPLQFATLSSIEGFHDGVYFGGYLGNIDKKPVNIYHRVGVDKWEIVYTFHQGSINHVHNIVADPYRNCVWIFTGDFDEASAIWKVTDNFKKVEQVHCNNQKYRGCVVYALPEGLLYATDAPFADDFIYLMDTDTYEVKEILPIAGSCIYGCKWKDKYVFSSTVEGDGRNMSRLEWILTRKRGAGIKDDYVHMYMGNINEGFKEIYREKKDSMPYYTFQFGVFKFPYGINNGDTLYFQPVATKNNDLSLMSLDWEDVK